MTSKKIDYKCIILDASFFKSLISDDTMRLLSGCPVLIPETFYNNIKQLLEILNPYQVGIMKKNMLKIADLGPETLTVDPVEKERDKLNSDTLNLIENVCKNNICALVITSDKLLIEKLILAGTKVDILDPENDNYYYQEEFESLSKELEIKHYDNSIDISELLPFKKGNILYRINGEAIVLDDKFSDSGAEAVLFKLRNENVKIAKIFKNSKNTNDKFINVVNILGTNDDTGITWAEFPRDIVFADKNRRIPVGFLMNKVAIQRNLSDNPMFTGDFRGIPRDDLYKKISSTVKLCNSIISQVRLLGMYGFYITDFNIYNFAEKDSLGKYIQMWDTDSFGYKNYYNLIGDGNMTIHEYDMKSKKGVLDYCTEALYIFMFKLLSLGDTPVSEMSGKFKYNNPNYRHHARKQFFPESIWKEFEQFFCENKKGSSEELSWLFTSYLEKARSARIDDPAYISFFNN